MTDAAAKSTVYYVLADKFRNANTAEYGFGDHPKRITYIAFAVRAETRSEAMKAAKRAGKGFIFSGVNANSLYSEEEMIKGGHGGLIDFAKKLSMWQV